VVGGGVEVLAVGIDREAAQLGEAAVGGADELFRLAVEEVESGQRAA
jgi:hypothetical protein